VNRAGDPPTDEQIREFGKLVAIGAMNRGFFQTCLINCMLAGKSTAARKIMSKRFIGVKDVKKNLRFGGMTLGYPDEVLADLEATFPEEEKLQKLAEKDYWLLPGPPAPMTLRALYQLCPNYFRYYFGRSTFLSQGFSTKERAEPGWYAVRKNPEIVVSVPDGYAAPNVAEVAWLFSVIYAVRYMRLFQDICVCTSTRSDANEPVYVDNTENGPMSIEWKNDLFPDTFKGILTIRKFGR